ncbi:FAD-dependent oxidoreductase [Mucilaginibacter arboris]|uniref:FAD-dependent oxidoreductase n=1 Tax=Mucilaginibacter arboris TaxID=2682090 RepID=A0A7K1SSN1_9SPHI|nr:FAD-dependent oxidoreductase [Mucilaginibacter arboris]MVN20110.1 FAD-dependent oxidoreductase [Mucilaginibacter arboris]
MKKICIFLFTFIFNSAAFAQTIKTGVLVIGGGAAGVAAGIQSARSNVKTIILEPGPWLGGSLTSAAMCVVDGNRNFPSGIWGEFRKRIKEYYKTTPGFDTTSNAVLRFEPAAGAAVLKKITDTAKNLTVHLNASFTGIKKDGTGYEVTAKINGENAIIKAQVVVDGTETGDVAAKLGVPFDVGFESEAQTGEKWAPKTALPIIQNITWIAILRDYGRAADRTIPKPEGYDEHLYTSLQSKNIKQTLESGRLPNDKFMLKVKGVNDYPVTIADFASASAKENAYQQARLKTLGLVYYLQTKLGYKNISLDNLEFASVDHLPYLPYIREVRRSKGVIKMVLDDIYTPYSRSSKLYRTSIGIGDASPGQHLLPLGKAPETNYGAFPAYSISAGAAIVKDFDNFLVAEKAMSVTHLVNASTMYPSVQMTVGQGIGCIAAYCAFFKTTTKSIKLRLIQNEILSYHGYLMPFLDVKQNDPQFIAIQKIGVTGLLQGVQKPSGGSAPVFFLPDSAVKTAEIKPVLSEIYTRSFLWFNKTKPAEFFTIGNMLSFIEELNLRDAKTFRLQIQNDWKTKLHLNTAFDISRPITRREFAALADVYLKPFDRSIDLTGKLLN